METEIRQQLLFTKDIEKITGLSLITLRRWWRCGKFLKPVKINGGLLTWHSEAIDHWIRQAMTT